MKKSLLSLSLLLAGACLSTSAQFVKTFMNGSDTTSSVNNGMKIQDAVLGSFPSGLAIDSKNKLIYLAASGGITSGSYILTLDTNNTKQVYFRAGNSATMGFADAGSTQAKFDILGNIVIDKGRTLYIADRGNNAIRKLTAFVNITQSQQVKTIVGGGDGLSNNTTGSSGYVEGTGVKALFNDPQWIALDESKGEIIVVDRGNNCIRAVDTAKKSTTLITGKKGSKTTKDGDLASSTFEDPSVCWVDQLTSDIWVFENNGKIRKVDRKNNKVTTIGTLDQAKLFAGEVSGVVKENNIFFLTYGCKIVSWDPAKPTVTTLVAGGLPNGDNSTDSCGGIINGSAKNSVFNYPSAMLLIGSPKGSSRILVADNQNSAIRSVYTDGKFSPVEATYRVSKSNNGFRLYPNPAVNEINVELSNYNLTNTSIQILTLEGKVIYTSGTVAEKIHKISLEGLNSGMYFIQVSGNHSVQTKRFIIGK